VDSPLVTTVVAWSRAGPPSPRTRRDESACLTTPPPADRHQPGAARSAWSSGPLPWRGQVGRDQTRPACPVAARRQSHRRCTHRPN